MSDERVLRGEAHARHGRRDPFSRIDNAFWDAGHCAVLSQAAVLVYGLLCRRANQSDQSFPGVHHIAEKTGMTTKSVIEAVKELRGETDRKRYRAERHPAWLQRVALITVERHPENYRRHLYTVLPTPQGQNDSRNDGEEITGEEITPETESQVKHLHVTNLQVKQVATNKKRHVEEETNEEEEPELDFAELADLRRFERYLAVGGWQAPNAPTFTAAEIKRINRSSLTKIKAREATKAGLWPPGEHR